MTILISKKTFMDLPTELLTEIAKFLNHREFHRWMVLSQSIFEKLSSDTCYAQWYWREVNHLCNADKKDVYNPELRETTNEPHKLYSTYGKISSNFRKELIQFKKDWIGNRMRFDFVPVEQLFSISSTVQKLCKQMKRGKVVIVGNGSAGKTSLIWRMSTGEFPEYTWYTNDYPSINYENMNFSLWDTAGQEDYDKLRALSYPGTDLVIICFSLIDRDHFNSIQTKWIREMRYHLQDCPMILVGCKYDLREEIMNQAPQPFLDSTRQDFITRREAEDLAMYLGCISYWECSSKEGFGMKNFVEIIVNGFAIGILTGKQNKKKCVLQ